MFELNARRKNHPVSLWEDFFDRDFFAPAGAGQGNFLNADVKGTDDQYVITVDIPGMDKDSIHIDYDNNQLTIAGERQEEHRENKKGYIRQERSFGSFSRSFYCDNLDPNGIKAAFQHGVLTITAPKVKEDVPNKYHITIE